MNLVIRWGKFNLVGAMGMVVQLGALAVFNRGASGHYLLATAAAIELTLLHNFVWHLHYTWRDRRGESGVLAALIRFHLTNGLVSMLGNLGMMRLLVQHAQLPILTSNCISILCCSILNFGLGNSWAFAGRSPGIRSNHLYVPYPELKPATTHDSNQHRVIDAITATDWAGAQAKGGIVTK